MGNASGMIRVGAGGGVPIASFTAASQSSPMAMSLDARGFKSWNFQLRGTISAGGVLVQGTLDGVNWFDLAPDNSGTSTGGNVNPIIALDAQLKYSGNLFGVRGVSNGTFAGTATLLGFSTP